MKSIDGDRLLSDLFPKLLKSKDVGDVVVRYQDLIIAVRNSSELPIKLESAEPARRNRDYNGYMLCSSCGSRIRSLSDNYCSKCGKKFII